MGKKFKKTILGGAVGSAIGGPMGAAIGIGAGAYKDGRDGARKKTSRSGSSADTGATEVDTVGGAGQDAASQDSASTWSRGRRRAAGTKIADGSDTFEGGTLGG